MNQLPKDLQNVIFLYLPYTQIKDCNLEDRHFWLQKARLEIGEEPEIITPTLGNYEIYLEILAHHGIAHPGSELILSIVEMFRHGLKGDRELLDYCWNYIELQNDHTLELILNQLLERGDIQELAKFPDFPGKDLIDHWYLEIFFMISKVEDLEKLSQVAKNKDLKRQLTIYLNAEQLHQDDPTLFVYDSVLVHGVLDGKEINNPEINVYVHILTRDLKKFSEDNIVGKRILYMRLIVLLDNIELIQIYLNHIPEAGRGKFVFGQIIKHTYYKSKIFNYLITTYSKSLTVEYTHLKSIISHKKETDFAGLITIFKHCDPKLRETLNERFEYVILDKITEA